MERHNGHGNERNDTIRAGQLSESEATYWRRILMGFLVLLMFVVGLAVAIYHLRSLICQSG